MEVGEQIRDYVLQSKIGEGGMGQVWLARNQVLDRHVAIKVVSEHASHKASFRDRFIREAQAMAKLEHPHIVPVHEFFVVGEDGFLVMGYINGQSLDQLGKIEEKAALQISREILDALDFAHQQGVIHRDVKPSNILVDARGHAYITDFGIALVAGTERLTRLTRAGTAVGTPEYMSPEQITTPGDLDHRADVYSFGCVLYEMLTGKPPFGSRELGTTEFELMEAHVRKQPSPIRQLNAAVDKNTESVVMRALAKHRDARFDGCGHMARDLFQSGDRSHRAYKMTLLHLLLSFKGRIGRSQFWKGVLILTAFNALMLLFASSLVRAESDLELTTAAISIISLWPSLALSIKRWHDRNRSAWWYLTCLIPYLQIIPLVWITIETSFLKGTAGSNRFGSSPW